MKKSIQSCKAWGMGHGAWGMGHWAWGSNYSGVTVVVALSILVWGALGAWLGLGVVVVGAIAGEIYLIWRERQTAGKPGL